MLDGVRDLTMIGWVWSRCGEIRVSPVSVLANGQLICDQRSIRLLLVFLFLFIQLSGLRLQNSLEDISSFIIRELALALKF